MATLAKASEKSSSSSSSMGQTLAAAIPQKEPPIKHTSASTATTSVDLQSDDMGTLGEAAAGEAAYMLDEEQGLVDHTTIHATDSGEEGGGVTIPLVDDEASASCNNSKVRHRRHLFPSAGPLGLRSSANRGALPVGSHISGGARKDSNDYIDDAFIVDIENNINNIPPLLSATDLTLSEKLMLISGKSLWLMNDLTPRIPSHILPSLRVSDGPHGVRKPLSEMNLQQSHPATCFPTAAALACSWDGPLLQQVGVALRLECLHYGISILLGPGMNLKRHAAGGRNFEYFSEDPLLTARCAAFYIHGIQASGQVAACAKHYAVNNQESHRFVVNAKIDERTCRELYLRHFEYVCKGPQESSLPPSTSASSIAEASPSSSPSVSQLGTSAIPATLMCSYNMVNGVHCSEHSVLLNDILRREWGYQGVVMTDWGATNNRAVGIKATLDLEMPGSHGAHNRIIRKALKASPAPAAKASSLSNEDKDDDPDKLVVSLSEQDHLDPCVDRILNLIHQLRDSSPDAVDASGTTATASTPPTVCWASHHELAKQVAMDCAVLLKNEGNLLPLKHNTSVAVIGDFANDHPRYQGMGSSQVFSECVISALTEFESYTNQVYFSKGYHADDEHFSHQQEQRNGQDEDDNDDMWIDTDLIDEAVQVAQKAEVVVLCIGLPALMESEGFDRPHLSLPAQHNALVHEICRVHKKVVVVLSNGGAVEMPWADEPQAIFEGYLLGETGGAAVVDLIFGRQSPCGKLAETFPIRQSDILADAYFPGTSDDDDYCVEHREGLQVGYRYFDSAQCKSVRFPFGHGLTYTTFAYSNLQASIRQDDEFTKVVDVSFSLTNTGKMTAKEIVQVYVHQVGGATVFRPEQELRDFDKILLKPGETKEVRFTLGTNAFSFYDIGHQDWIVEPHGAFEIRVSASSRDVRLRQTIQFTAGRTASTLAQSSYPPQQQNHNHDIMVVDDATFIKRFGNRRAGFEYVAPKTSRRTTRTLFHRNSLLKQVADSRIVGGMLLWSVYKASLHQTSAGSGRMTHRQKVLVKAAVENLPLRALVLFSKRALSFEMLDVLIALFNYQLGQAIKCLFIAMTPFRNK